MLTVRHLITSFISSIEILVSNGTRKPGTLKFYQHGLSKLDKAAGGMPADTLRAYHLAGVRFTNHFVRSAKALYRWALEEELVPKDPFRKIKTPKPGQRRRVLQRSEMTRLYLASQPRFRRFLFGCRYTMARPRELRELRWEDVHFEARAILLHEFKSKDQRNDGAEARVIALAEPLVRLLKNMKRRQGTPGPKDPVFPNRFGLPLTSYAVRCAMRRARKKAGLVVSGSEQVVCYTLRHTGATEATRAGVRDNLLARMLGHTSTRTTQRYQHLDCGDLVNGIDQVVKRKRKPA